MSDVYQSLRAALSDRYRLDRELGRGGMATVFLAHDLAPAHGDSSRPNGDDPVTSLASVVGGHGYCCHPLPVRAIPDNPQNR